MMMMCVCAKNKNSTPIPFSVLFGFQYNNILIKVLKSSNELILKKTKCIKAFSKNQQRMFDVRKSYHNADY